MTSLVSISFDTMYAMDDIKMPGYRPITNIDNEEKTDIKSPEEAPSEAKIEPEQTPNKPPKPKRKFLPYFKRVHLSRKQWLIVGLVCILLIGGGVMAKNYLAKRFTKLAKEPPAKVVPKPPKPTTEPSRLTGVTVPVEMNSRPVTGIIIENSPDARPQAGLKDAGILYEAIAEGGITRFLALYQEAQPDYIGPVRSARPYYLDWLMPFEAAIAHVGGSPEALAQIKSLGVRDLDQFANSGAYQRISKRYAPHNVYTSMAQMDALQKAKGYTSSKFTSYTRKKDAPNATPTARSIDFALSGFLYNPHYDYDAATNSYKRSQGGKPHTDEKSGAQLQPKVVIALVMAYAIQSDGKHSEYTTTGSGVMFVFQDGVVTQGTWTKPDRKAPFKFTDANGAVLKLNAGQTWITAVGLQTGVTYKP